jgi:DNA-binding MarR family transcriptional regulator
MVKGLSRKLNFGVLVHEVSRIRRKAIDQLMKPLGITGGQWWVLTYVSLHAGKSQGELAEELNMGKVAFGGVIDRLEKSGFIERRVSKVDRRMKRVHLSPRGRELVEEIRELSTSVQASALDGISMKELEHAISALTKMEANLQEFIST